jgi:hypothetical protein
VRTESVRSFLVFFEIAGAVFAVITWTISSVTQLLRLSRSFLVFLEIAGAVFAVITWTISSVTSLLRLSRPKVDGARPWARAPALNVTETNAVASAKKIRGLRTSARYAGNHKLWQAFFSTKIVAGRFAYQGEVFDAH